MTDLRNYLSLVSERATQSFDPQGRASAVATITRCLSVTQRLLAPFMPFATEEVWARWQDGSIHHSPWPTTAEVEAAGAADDDKVLDVAFAALRAIRRERAAHRMPNDAEAQSCVLGLPSAALELLVPVASDVRAAGLVRDLDLAESCGSGSELLVTLAP
jgi:valyl-tRNA synthetase